MEKRKFGFLFTGLCLLLATSLVSMLPAQETDDGAGALYYSTEEDFVAGVDLPGGSVVSDGDLLIAPGRVYMRNAELLKPFYTDLDLGLDAVDVIEEAERIVVFSTELAHPRGLFGPGDLLSNTGVIIPNAVLLNRFRVLRELNLGLDAVQMIGNTPDIIEFLHKARGISREEWREQPELLQELLKAFRIDIWFSTEGTPSPLMNSLFIDGDLLSALNGTIVISNFNALPVNVPAGITSRGIDFGMDAAAVFPSNVTDIRRYLCFSTEILFEGRPGFSDGDVLLNGSIGIYDNYELIRAFRPKVDFLGLDALSLERLKNIIINEDAPALALEELLLLHTADLD